MCLDLEFYFKTWPCQNQKAEKLICLHGFAENSSTWNNLELKNHDIYALDFYGHGKSPTPKKLACYYFENVITSLHSQISKLYQEPYHLLGYSMGGRLALYYALTYPKEVKSLILESSGFGIFDETQRQKRLESDRALAENILSKGLEWFADYWSDLPIFQSQNKLSKPIQEQIMERRLGNDKLGLANTLLGMGQGVLPYLGNRLEELSMPILYLSGANDQKYVKIGQKFASFNQNVQTCIIDDAGHNVHLEKPQIFQEILQTFLRKR